MKIKDLRTKLEQVKQQQTATMLTDDKELRTRFAELLLTWATYFTGYPQPGGVHDFSKGEIAELEAIFDYLDREGTRVFLRFGRREPFAYLTEEPGAAKAKADDLVVELPEDLAAYWPEAKAWRRVFLVPDSQQQSAEERRLQEQSHKAAGDSGRLLRNRVLASMKARMEVSRIISSTGRSSSEVLPLVEDLAQLGVKGLADKHDVFVDASYLRGIEEQLKPYRDRERSKV